MFPRQRRRLPVVSESSDEDPPLRGRQTRASTQTQSLNIWLSIGSSKRQIERQDSSDSGQLFGPRKKQKLPISTSEESSSSEDEEILRLGKRGCMRALSDYETGDSSGPSRRESQQERSFEAKEESDSSSCSDVVRTRSGTSRKRQSDLISTTDSSDSGIPVGFNRQRKRTKLATTSEESNSGESSDSEPIRAGARRGRPAAVSSDPSTSRLGTVRQRAPGPVRFRYNTRGASLNTQPASENLSSNSDTGGRVYRRLSMRSPSLESDNTNTDFICDSDDSFRIPLHYGGVLQNSDDSSSSSSSGSVTEPEATTVKRVSTCKTSSPKKKKPCVNSSDSDGESEKCPICLARFGSQNIGIPGSCEHRFCSVCIREWAKNNNTCPVDRKLFNVIKVLSEGEDRVICEVRIETPPERAVEGELWDAFNIINTIYEEFGGSDDNSDGPDEVCCVCFNNNRTDNMIVCDYCDNVFHMNCLEPPLRYVPATDWCCPDCRLVMSSSDSD